MFEAFIIYLYTVLHGAMIVSWVFVFLSIIVYLFLRFNLWTEARDEEGKYLHKKFPKKLAILALIVALFIPNHSDLKFIIGGSLVWNGAKGASQIEGVDKLPENLVGAMNYFLEEVQGKK